MKNTVSLILSLLVCFAWSCRNNTATDNKTAIKPWEDLARIDELLREIAPGIRIYNIPSDKITRISGAAGTIITVDPSSLETIDSTALGDTISVELLEATDLFSMITNNIRTVSDSSILVTGGAYYINMTSDGKQLRIKEGKGISVEFPVLSDNEMEMFLGERDSLGQINWIPLQKKFNTKNIEKPEVPVKPDLQKGGVPTYRYYTVRAISVDEPYDTILPSRPKEVKKEEASEPEYQAYLKEMERYNEKVREIEICKRTYEAVSILNFGWINCDRFYESEEEKTDIALNFNKDSINSARFMAVFRDMKSILNQDYWLNKQGDIQFSNIPENMNITIIGIAFRDSIPLWFSEDIRTGSGIPVDVDFTFATQEQIREKLISLSK